MNMKRNANLYLPWPIVSAFLASTVPATDPQLYRADKLFASVERLKGGCLLYRLRPEAGHVRAPPTC
jgi:hypothetical protein